VTDTISINLRPDLDTDIRTLVAAMNENAATGKSSSHVGFEVTESRRKYHLLNAVLSNGQRSGLFLIDRNTHVIYQSIGYGKTNGRPLGTVASMTVAYKAATATYAATHATYSAV